MRSSRDTNRVCGRVRGRRVLCAAGVVVVVGTPDVTVRPGVVKARSAVAPPPGFAGRRAMDTTVLNGLRVRQHRSALLLSRAGRVGTRFAMDTLIDANGAFAVALLDAVRPQSGGRSRSSYVVLAVSGGANALNPGGFCGAGTERAVLWLAVDGTARVTRVQTVLVDSCRKDRYSEGDTLALQGDSLRMPYWVAHSDSSFVVAYSRRAPERGLVVRPAPPETP